SCRSRTAIRSPAWVTNSSTSWGSNPRNALANSGCCSSGGAGLNRSMSTVDICGHLLPSRNGTDDGWTVDWLKTLAPFQPDSTTSGRKVRVRKPLMLPQNQPLLQRDEMLRRPDGRALLCGWIQPRRLNHREIQSTTIGTTTDEATMSVTERRVGRVTSRATPQQSQSRHRN